MVLRIVDQTVIGIDDPFLVPGPSTVVDIAFVVDASVLFWQSSFPVTETVSADAAVLADILQIAFAGNPAHVFYLVFADIIGWQFMIGIQI